MCLVYLFARISQETSVQTLGKFLYVSSAAMARSMADNNALYYISGSWMTPDPMGINFQRIFVTARRFV